MSTLNNIKVYNRDAPTPKGTSHHGEVSERRDGGSEKERHDCVAPLTAGLADGIFPPEQIHVIIKNLRRKECVFMMNTKNMEIVSKEGGVTR